MKLLQVSKIFKEGANGSIVDNISFSLRRHQKIALAGETGSGKSTVFKIIAGLLHPDRGEVVFENSVVSNRDALIPGTPGIAYLSQDFALSKSLRVEQILEYANERPVAESTRLYKVCKISHLLKRRANELSGGERQRIAIAQLLTTSPTLLLLDEPYSNLDRVHKTLLKSVIDNIGTRLGITCMIISHDPEDLLSWADTIMILKRGKLVQQGAPEKIYNSPKTAYVAGLLGRYTVVRPASPWQLEIRDVPAARIKWYARPENITLQPGGKGEGIVRRILFLGDHYVVEVSSNGQTVTAKSAHGNYQVGENVRFELTHTT
ncbi:MAG: ABC transporter ATP-binding protein [Chryseolinea sp.]